VLSGGRVSFLGVTIQAVMNVVGDILGALEEDTRSEKDVALTKKILEKKNV